MFLQLKNPTIRRQLWVSEIRDCDYLSLLKSISHIEVVSHFHRVTNHEWDAWWASLCWKNYSLKTRAFQKEKVIDKNGHFSAKLSELPAWRGAVSLPVHRSENVPNPPPHQPPPCGFMSQVGNRLLGVIEINQLWGSCSLFWQSVGRVFILCVCVCVTERYFEKVAIEIYIYTHTQNAAQLQNNGGMPNSLCQKMDRYHQYHMELIISKEL